MSEEQELIGWLEQEGYLHIKKLNTGELAGLHPFLFTVGICVGLDEVGYTRRFCYHTWPEAKEALESWDGSTKTPPGNVVAHK